MTHLPRPRRPLTTSASAQPPIQRQLSMAFESPVLQGMDPSERNNAIDQLAIVLLQASGIQVAEAHDDEL